MCERVRRATIAIADARVLPARYTPGDRIAASPRRERATVPSQEPTRILLVSLSAIWVTSVRTVLASLPAVEVVGIAHGGLGAYQFIRSEQPALVIIDDTLPADEMAHLLALVKALPERPYSIVVVSTSRQAPQALGAGADAVVPRSQAGHDLVATVAAAADKLRTGGTAR